MTCQQFRLVLGYLGELGLEGSGYASMKSPTRLPQQCPISGILHQRMFEQVAVGASAGKGLRN